METNTQLILNKNRSYTACIAAAYKMFSGNIKLIFRHTWAFAAVLALSVTLYYICNIGLGYDPTTADFVKVGVSALILILADIAFSARVMMLFDKQPMRWNVIRCLKLTLFEIVLVVLWSVIIVTSVYFLNSIKPFSYERIALIILAFVVVAVLLSLPLIYVVMRYFMDTDCKLHKVLFKSYATGIRHWGLIFTTSLLAFLIVAALTAIVSLPTIIVIIADTLSVYGVKMLGDLPGLPSWFGVLRLSAFALTTFACLYINIFLINVFYFVYGSIEVKDAEKDKFLNQKL